MTSQYDVVVAGGGLAGMSAALTVGRLGLTCMILTGGVPGGQLVSIEKIDGVPGFPDGVPGYDLCPMAQEQAGAAGVELSTDSCVRLVADNAKWRVISSGGEIIARGLVIATGASLAKLGVPGEERLNGKGVSHCASCDAPLLRNRTVAVIGAGDSAMQEALTLAEYVGKVIVIDRDKGFRGQRRYVERMTGNDKIELRTGQTVTEVLGTERIEGIHVKDLASGSQSEIEVAAVFPFVGLVPNGGLVRDVAALDATGRIVVDASMRSTARGICAAGNVRQGSPHRAAGAMGDGATAAVALNAWVVDETWGQTV